MDSEQMNTTGHTFTYNAADGSTVSFFVHQDADLSEMCAAFERYLRASGYVFDADANVEIIEPGFWDCNGG
jgi:hypothetical protein